MSMSVRKSRVDFNGWVNFGLLTIGFSIFAFSLYMASLSGLRRQLGIVGGDLRQSINVNRLYREIIDVGAVPECNYWKSIAQVPRYVFVKGHEKIRLGQTLSNLRVECGITYLLAGNTDRGIYTLLKALRYDLVGLTRIIDGIRSDRDSYCQVYQSDASFGLVEAYLDSAEGNARGIIQREYNEVQRLHGQIQELCGLE